MEKLLDIFVTQQEHTRLYEKILTFQRVGLSELEDVLLRTGRLAVPRSLLANALKEAGVLFSDPQGLSDRGNPNRGAHAWRRRERGGSK